MRSVSVHVSKLIQPQRAVVETGGSDARQASCAEQPVLAALFDSLDQAIVIYSPDLSVLSWNAAMERLTGVSAAAIEGRHPWDVIPDTAEEFWRPILENAMAGKATHLEGRPYNHFETREAGWLDIRVEPLRGNDGTVLATFAVAVDITEQWRLSGALLDSEQRLKLIIENEPECVKLLDRQGCITYMNPAGLQIIDAEYGSNVIGVCVEGMLVGRHKGEFRKALNRVFEGESVRISFQAKSLKGRVRWLDSRMVPLRDKDGAVTAALGLTQDVTDQRRLDQERDQLLNQLRQANEDLTSLSHIAGATRTLDLDQLVRESTDTLRARLGCELAEVLLADADGQGAQTPSDEWLGSALRAMGSHNIGELSGHVSSSHSLLGDLLPKLRELGVERLHCVPLESEGVLRGVLAAGRASGGAFSAREVRLLEQVAHRIAAAIVNARLYWQLSESREHLQYAMDAAVLGGFDWNIATGEAKWFGHHERMFGFEPGEFNGTLEGFYSRIHPDDRKGIEEALDRAITRHIEYRHRYRVVWPDGTIRWIEGFGSTAYGEGGEPQRMGGVVMDVTERVEKERRAESVAAHYRQLGEMITDYAFIGTLDREQGMVVTWVSESITRIFGYVLEDLRDGWRRIMHPEEVGFAPDTLQRISQGEKIMLKRRWITKDGRVRWLRLYVVPLVDSETGQVASIMGAAEDITEAKLAQELADANRERFELAARATNDVIWDGDLRANTVWWGGNMATVFGHRLPSEPLPTGFWRAHVHPDDLGTVSTIIAKCLASNESYWSAEYRFQKADGTYAHVLDRACVQRDNNGEPLRMIGAIMDLTDRATAARERERLMLELQQANEDLRAMSSITEGTHGTLDLHELLQEYVSRVAGAVQSDMAGIALIDGDRLVMEEVVGVPGPLRVWHGVVGRGFLGHVARTRRPEFVPDVREHPEFVGPIAKGMGLKGMFAVPIEHSGEVIGVLGIGWKKVMEPNPRFQRILSTTAERAALAIQNARLFSDLRQAQATLMRALDAAAMGVFDWDLKTERTEWLGHHDRLFGVNAARVSESASFVDRAHPEDLPTVRAFVEHACKTNGEYRVEFRVVWPDGSLHWLSSQGRFDYDDAGTPTRVSGVVREITAQKEAEEALRHLSQRLQKAREDERATLARTVHDDLGQALTALKMEAGWARRSTTGHGPDLTHHLDLMLAQIDSALERVRDISSKLRLAVLDDLGLCAAIDWEARAFEKRTGIRAIVQGTDREVAFGTDASLAFYRILQEALTNVTRHAQASEVTIALRVREGRGSLSVRDNGVGATDTDFGGREALGILGMRERAEAIGGTLEVKSRPGGGTKVIVRAPVDTRDEPVRAKIGGESDGDDSDR